MIVALSFGQQAGFLCALSRLAWLRLACLASRFVAGFCRKTVKHFSGTCLDVHRRGTSASGGWAKTVNHYKAMGTKIVGLTGSPERLDGKPLGECGIRWCWGRSTGWLIQNGFLAKCRAFAPAGVDLSGVRSRGGDYVTSDIDEIMAGKTVLAGAMRHWRKFALGKRTIAFAPSIARSERLAAEFRGNGSHGCGRGHLSKPLPSFILVAALADVGVAFEVGPGSMPADGGDMR